MKTVIKIRDRHWFKGHCRVVSIAESGAYIEPKYPPWRHVLTIPWSLDIGGMSQLVGQVLEAGHDDGIDSGKMDNARYFAGGYWIPNWAIEWVKETE